MARQKKSGTGPKLKKPLLVLMSRRSRFREILAAGLIQSQYRVIQANGPEVAHVLAMQFCPDLVLIDITPNTIQDILLLNRLNRSERTKSIHIITIIPLAFRQQLDKFLEGKDGQSNTMRVANMYLVDFPFKFADLLAMVSEVLGIPGYGRQSPSKLLLGDSSSEAQVAAQLFNPRIAQKDKCQLVMDMPDQKRWVFPHTVSKAVDIIGDESSCCRELAECIGTDATATSSVLRVANTVYYSLGRGRITHINDAVVRLGFDETRNLLSCFALIDLTQPVRTDTGFTRREFWLHSLSVAFLAEELTRRAGMTRPGLAFVSGLIHDIGKIPLDNNFSDVFPNLLRDAATNMRSYAVSEQTLMGFTHAFLGHHLTTQWNLPKAITSAILHHQDGEAAASAFLAGEGLLQGTIYVANQLAKAMGMGYSCDEVLEEIPLVLTKKFDLERLQSNQFFGKVMSEVNAVAEYLEIPVRKLSLTLPSPDVADKPIVFVYGSHSPFHPLVLALARHGYHVRSVSFATAEIEADASVMISMPYDDSLLDLTLQQVYESEEQDRAPVRIFITNTDTDQSEPGTSGNERTTFINPAQLDVRLILHILDRHLGRVVVPAHAPS